MRIMPTLKFSPIYNSIKTQSNLVQVDGDVIPVRPMLGKPASHSRARVRRQIVARIVASDFAPRHSADGAGPGAGRGLSRRWCAVADASSVRRVVGRFA